MSNKDLKVLESLKLAEDLLEAIKKDQKVSKNKKKSKKINNPPKWLLGKEILFKPEEDS